MRRLIKWNLITLDGFFEGPGTPLFRRGLPRWLRLLEARTFASGDVLLCLVPPQPAPATA
jgi:hypothetical protein